MPRRKDSSTKINVKIHKLESDGSALIRFNDWLLRAVSEYAALDVVNKIKYNSRRPNIQAQVRVEKRRGYREKHIDNIKQVAEMAYNELYRARRRAESTQNMEWFELFEKYIHLWEIVAETLAEIEGVQFHPIR